MDGGLLDAPFGGVLALCSLAVLAISIVLLFFKQSKSSLPAGKVGSQAISVQARAAHIEQEQVGRQPPAPPAWHAPPRSCRTGGLGGSGARLGPTARGPFPEQAPRAASPGDRRL